MLIRRRFQEVIAVSLAAASVFSSAEAGHWQWTTTAPPSSSNSDGGGNSSWNFWSTIDLYITTDEEEARVDVKFSPWSHWVNVSAPLNGSCVINDVTTTVFTPNPFQGLRFLDGAEQTTCMALAAGGSATTTLVIDEAQSVHASTGLTAVQQTRTLEYTTSSANLTYTVTRSTRESFAECQEPP